MEPLAAAFFCSCAMACARRVFAAASAIAPPSTSKSTLVRPYASMVFWYAAVRSATEPQTSASSLPLAPPKDARTLPPTARSAPICAATASVERSLTPPHFGVQPPPETTKARLKFLTPVALAVATRS